MLPGEAELRKFRWCVEERYRRVSARRNARTMDLARSRSTWIPSHIGATNLDLILPLDLRFVSDETNADERHDLRPSPREASGEHPLQNG